MPLIGTTGQDGISMTVELPPAGLLLVGLGPGGLSGMTLAAVEAATAADHRWYEAYTALWPEADLAALEARVGPIERVMRPDVEHPTRMFELAQDALVALLVVGDPLQATTHVDLQLRAQEEGIPCHVLHGLSITGMVTGAAGLSNYRFGRQTTLTYPHGAWIATSPLETIAVNRHLGLHTLVLLDLDPTGAGTGDQRPMRPEDAHASLHLMAKRLAERPAEEGSASSLSVEALEGLDVGTWTVVLCADVGTADEMFVTTTVDGLPAERGGRLNCLLVPAAVEGVEAAAIARWQRS
ncbi:MAG: diphthine synthase [Candidatus Poseidoniaceae archaeon]